MICEIFGQIGIRCSDLASVAWKIRIVVGAELFLLGVILIIGAFVALACPGKVQRLKREHVAISLWVGMGLLFAPAILGEPMRGCGSMPDTSMSPPIAF